MNGTLAARKTTTQHDDAISHLILIEIVVVDDDHVITINAWDGRNERRGTHSENQRIDALLLHILRRNGGVQTNLHTLIFCLTLQDNTQLIHFIFKRQRLF